MCAKQATSVQLKIAGVVGGIVIHHFNDKFHWDNHDYHFMGCDALAQLPPFIVDLMNKMFCIEGNQICIENRINRPLRNLKIHALETCEIRPNEQSVIKAKINFPELLRHNIWIHSMDNRLQQEGLKSKTYYDRLIRNPTVTIGDRVLLRNYAGKIGSSKKFHLPWKGVFRVIEINGVHVNILSCNSP